MRGMLQPTGRHVVEQPHPNDFANMLGDIFSGNFGRATVEYERSEGCNQTSEEQSNRG